MIMRRLPRFGAPLLLLYRILWVVTFAGGVAATLYFSPSYEVVKQRATRAAYALSFAPYLYDTPVGQMGGPFGQAGRDAGLKPGDLLLKVDGRTVPTDPLFQPTVLEGPDGSRAVLTVKRQTGEIDLVRVQRRSGLIAAAYAGSGLTFEMRRWTQVGFYALASLFALGAALLLFLRRPHDVVAQLLSSYLILDQFNVYNWYPSVPDPVMTIKISITTLLGVSAVLLFPDGRLNSRWHRAALGISVVALLYGIISYYRLGTFGLLGPMLLALATISIAIAMLAQFRNTPAGIERQQIKFVIFGIVALAALQTVATILVSVERLAMDEGVVAWIALAKHLTIAMANLALPAGLLVSLLRYRLYDVDAVISRSAAYAFLTLLVGAAFAGSEKIIEVLGEQMFGESSRVLSAGLGAAVAAMLIAPLHNRVHHWTEHRFQRGLAQLRARLPLRIGDMREFATLEALLSTVAGEVISVLRATRVVALASVHGEQLSTLVAQHVAPVDVSTWMAQWQPSHAETLECDRADPLFPARLRLHTEGVGLTGWLLLGPRPDGTFYGKDEREALAELADPIARAIYVIRQRDASKEKVVERIQDLEGAVDRLLRTLASLGGPAAGDVEGTMSS